MLALNRLKLTQFKNYDFGTYEFTERVVGICGLNGKGKTNLLDAIYYCCFTKSYFTGADQMNIRFGTDGFRLESYFEKENQEHKLVCIHRINKKEVLLDDSPYEKFSQHIGFFPAVIIAPDDVEIISGGSEERRRYLDILLSQLDQNYLQKLMHYNKLLLQRNSLLKQFAGSSSPDLILLDIIDEQMVEPATYIYDQRKAFTSELVPLIEDFYHQLAANDEKIELQYQSQLRHADLKALQLKSLERDRYLQRTTQGIHKDDIVLSLNGQPFRSLASQGQRKSLLFALKLAEFQTLKKHKGFAPILLLDDVFEKLDEKRMENLLTWVCKQNEGQVFISDTHRSRLENAFAQIGVAGQIIEL